MNSELYRYDAGVESDEQHRTYIWAIGGKTVLCLKRQGRIATISVPVEQLVHEK